MPRKLQEFQKMENSCCSGRAEDSHDAVLSVLPWLSSRP
jgi:hypothetical protein